MSTEDSQETPQKSSQGSLSPEEEERARLEREARRGQDATLPQGGGGVPGSLGLAGNEGAATPRADYGYNNDSHDFAARGLNEVDLSSGSGGDAAGGLFQGIGRGLNYVAEKTTNAMSAAGGQAADLTSATASALGNAGGAISGLAGTVADSAASGALTLASNAAGAAEQVANAVGSIDIGGVADAAGAVAGAAAQAAGGVAAAVGSLPLGEILGASGEVLGVVAEGAGEVVGGVLGAVLDNL